MSSPFYFEFLAAVWEQLPDRDKERFGELWQGYEQVIGAIYQTYMENLLNISVSDLQAWATERWLPYTFNTSTFVERAAILISSQDLSMGINLQTKYLLKIRINGTNLFEVNLQGEIPQVTRIEEIVEKLNIYAGFKFAKTIYEGSIIQMTSNMIGVNSSIEILETSIPEANACEYVLGVDPLDLPQIFPKFRYPFTISYPRVTAIPEFRNHIRDEDVTVTLTEEVDYTVESGGIVSFTALPLTTMWAERTQVNDENPWANYGFLTGIYQENSARYVGVVQGLWFAVWNGPTPANVRRAIYLIFGLPTAPYDGTITRLTTTAIDVTSASGEVATFEIPTGLESEVTLGQSVQKFDPLVSGVWVYDKVNTPNFIQDEVGREGIQRFLLDEASRGYGDTDETKALTMLEEYTFLPQISVDAFIYPDINIRNVRLFLDAFKPLNKTYLFQIIIGVFRDLLGLTDRLGLHIDIDLTPNLDSNETTFLQQSTLDDYETIDNDPLNLDPHVILFGDKVAIEVRSFGVLIDSFTA